MIEFNQSINESFDKLLVYSFIHLTVSDLLMCGGCLLLGGVGSVGLFGLVSGVDFLPV